MKILFDLHTHTVYSRAPVGTHGKGQIAENLSSALEKGMGVGITDHGPGHSFYGARPKDYPAMRRELSALNDKLGFCAALLGVEANILSTDGRTDLDLIKEPLDIMLMGYHKGVLPKGKNSWPLLFPCNFKKEKALSILTDALIAAFARYPIDVLTHPGEYVPIDMKRLAPAAVQYGVALEINNRHHMAPEDIQTALSCGAHFILSSDAHRPEAVGGLSNALEIVRNMKIDPARIVNSDAYPFKSGLRLDRLKAYSENFRKLSTDSPQSDKAD